MGCSGTSLGALCAKNSLSCPMPCSLIAHGKSGMFVCLLCKILLLLVKQLIASDLLIMSFHSLLTFTLHDGPLHASASTDWLGGWNCVAWDGQ